MYKASLTCGSADRAEDFSSTAAAVVEFVVGGGGMDWGWGTGDESGFRDEADLNMSFHGSVADAFWLRCLTELAAGETSIFVIRDGIWGIWIDFELADVDQKR